MVFEYLHEAGANYGWPYYEGPDRFARYPAARLPAGPPIFSYKCGETATSGCAITAGAFYNPQQGQFPNGCRGEYFFTDICSQWIRWYDPATDSVAGFATDAPHPVNLEVSRDGSLFYLSRPIDGALVPSGR
jgi:glucose/arabinose dehydrogenase